MFESLESRKLFSAALADASALTPTTAGSTTALNFTKIKHDYVPQQGFTFTKKASSDEAGFVMKKDKSTPTL